MTKFKQLSEDPTAKRKNRLQSFFKTICTKKNSLMRQLANKYSLLDLTHQNCMVSRKIHKDATLKKIHKDATLLRPIIPQAGSYTYQLAKFLLHMLLPLASNDYSIKDSFSFAEELLSIRTAP